MTKVNWGDYIAEYFDYSRQEFHRSSEYKELKESLDDIENMCKNNFSETDFKYALAWVLSQKAVHEMEVRYMYECGYQDCAAKLRQLQPQPPPCKQIKRRCFG